MLFLVIDFVEDTTYHNDIKSVSSTRGKGSESCLAQQATKCRIKPHSSCHQIYSLDHECQIFFFSVVPNQSYLTRSNTESFAMVCTIQQARQPSISINQPFYQPFWRLRARSGHGIFLPMKNSLDANFVSYFQVSIPVFTGNDLVSG
jgi:hypothetical protein